MPLRPARAAIALLLSAAACSPRPAEPLRVATHVWTGFEPLYLAAELGYYGEPAPRFKEQLSGSAGLAAFRAGSVDAVALTLDEALLLAQDGVDARVALVLDTSEGADAIVARPGIASVAGLRGRRVGVETSALGAYVLSRALEGAGLRPADVVVVPLTTDRQEQGYAAGKVDAVVTYDPARTRLVARGARVIFDSAAMPGEIVDVLVVRGEVLRRRRADVDRIVEGWHRALAYLAAARADACARMARRQGLTGPEFEATLSGIRLMDREANRRLLGGPAPELLGTARRLAAVMREAGLLRGEVEPAALVEAAPGAPGRAP